MQKKQKEFQQLPWTRNCVNICANKHRKQCASMVCMWYIPRDYTFYYLLLLF